MMKRILLGGLITAMSVTVAAQVLTPSPQTVQHAGSICFQDTDTSGTNLKCAQWNMSMYSAVVFQITGTFSGTLTFEGTSDGSTWFAVQARNLSSGTAGTTTTGTGQFLVINSGFMALRARGSSWSSGAANITMTRGLATAAP